MKIQFISKSFSKLSSGTLVLGIFEGNELTASAKQVNSLIGGSIISALLVGLGKAEKIDELLMQSVGGGICE